jgi:hypothetical protein
MKVSTKIPAFTAQFFGGGKIVRHLVLKDKKLVKNLLKIFL